MQIMPKQVAIVLIPKVLLNSIQVLEVLVTLGVFFLFQNFSECRGFKELCGKLIFTRRGLVV